MRESDTRTLRTPWSPEPKYRWFQEAKFGLFIHWGLYAVPAGRWKLRATPGLCENMMLTQRIPLAEYEPLAERFSPTRFDADAWVRLAAAAGMRYLVITAKHSDGFSMYASSVTDYNVARATPFGRDVVRELADACRRHGLTFCFYYSQVLDGHHPDAEGNTWDFPEAGKDFQRYLDAKVKPQLRELLTDYGPVGLIWFDVPCKISYAQCKELADLVHSIQPDCLCNARLGHGLGDYTTAEDNCVPVAGFGQPWETPATMNDSWGFNADDHRWKTSCELIRRLVEVVSKGGNYLLDIGPTADGDIPGAALRVLQEFSRWMAANGASVHGARPSPFPSQCTAPWGTCTAKEGVLYLHVLQWPTRSELVLSGVRGAVRRAYLLADPAKRGLEVLRPQPEDLCVRIPAGELPAPLLDPADTVVAVEFEGGYEVDWALPVDGGVETVLPSHEAVLSGADLAYAPAVWEACIATTPTWAEGAAKWAALPPEHVVDRISCLTNWRNAGSQVRWDLRVERAGRYAVALCYAADAGWAGGTFAVEVAGNTLSAEVLETGSWYTFATREMGEVVIQRAGRTSLIIRPARLAGAMLMNLRSVALRPL